MNLGSRTSSRNGQENASLDLTFAASLREESLSMNVLVMNPGGNSLKVEFVSCSPVQQFAFEGSKLLSLTVEGIGKKPSLSILQGKEVTHSEEIEAKDYAAAGANILSWLEEEKHISRSDIECVGLRVVHGGRRFAEATVVTAEVEQQIRDYERLAPLHNKSSLECSSRSAGG
jgi:acetate kinase